ncbi:dihydroneopterin aldolase [Arcobacter arenosus]|uniref:dihydroneopterin aldolase n=1 Tax=Arcobacter arenosus TaxID=2576037 RepID=A0A5R8Y6X1_9BACT|nr:dihydroneopterin aldolase [Arcobacter arenosus]TLP41242.1 dihydroneopterin aldolase [Arcobacter arenosus]
MKVYIEDLNFDCIIGILDFERETAQKVIINLSFEYDFSNKDEFIDYSKVSNDIENIMTEKKFELLEEAIIYIENNLTNSYKIKNLKIKISKPDIMANCIVSLEN